MEVGVRSRRHDWRMNGTLGRARASKASLGAPRDSCRLHVGLRFGIDFARAHSHISILH